MDIAEKSFLHNQVSVKEFSELILEMTPPLQPNFVSSFIITVVFKQTRFTSCNGYVHNGYMLNEKN